MRFVYGMCITFVILITISYFAQDLLLPNGYSDDANALLLAEQQKNADTAERIANFYPSTALNHIVLFNDFSCPNCKEEIPVIKRIMGEYDNNVEVTFAHLPNKVRDKEAFRASLSFECALAEGQGIPYADLLFQSQGSFSPELFFSFADSLSLDQNEFALCVTANETAQKVLGDIDNAVLLNVQGTPTIFVNGKVLEGFQSYDQIIRWMR